MRLVFGLLLFGHALLHLLGPAKAFRLAELTQLSRDISRPLGVVWLLAALSLLAACLTFFAWPRAFWVVGAIALLLSQTVICTSWSDAKFGTLPNVVLLVAVVLSFARLGPLSARASYEREAALRSGDAPPAALLGETDLAPLPPPVQRYLRVSGALGQPKVHSMRLRFSGQIRSSATAPWMPFTAEQQSFFAEPARLFLMAATQKGLPFDVLHVFARNQASMRVRIAGLIPFISAHGDDITRAETVTLLNDMAVMAPATLIDPRITWRAIDAGHAEAAFTLGKNTVRATLVFGENGDLVDFVSDDRLMASPDGKTFTRLRWSTPLADIRWFGPPRGEQPGTTRIAASAQTLWHEPAAPYAYGQFQLLSVEYNPDTAPPR
jgi:hypothetical protein